MGHPEKLGLEWKSLGGGAEKADQANAPLAFIFSFEPMAAFRQRR